MLLMHDDFTAALRGSKTVDEFLKIVDDADEKEAGVDERLAEGSGETASGGAAEAAESTWPVIIAVTSCPTGIAHTYMAAKASRKRQRRPVYASR